MLGATTTTTKKERKTKKKERKNKVLFLLSAVECTKPVQILRVHWLPRTQCLFPALQQLCSCKLYFWYIHLYWYRSIDLFLYTLWQSVKLLVVSASKERETTVRYQKSLFVTDSRCHWTGYLLRLCWASLSKLSKSMESYLLFVEAGSKSSEWESGNGATRMCI